MDWTQNRAKRVAEYRKGLHPLYLPIYDFLATNLPLHWAPYFGVRSIEEQQALYMQGRDKFGVILDASKIVTYAMPGNSPHQYGCASDWTVFDDNGVPQWSLPVVPWDEYSYMVEKAGGRWGGDFQMKDKPHNELPISCSWRVVGDTARSKGIVAARKLIESSFLR